MKLYVGNLPFSATENDIRALFDDFGSVVDMHIPMDRETGRPRGFAFVTLSSREFGEAAINSLDGRDMGGRSLRISEAQERAPRSGGGGGGGGDRDRDRDRRGGGGRDHRDRDRGRRDRY